MSIVDGAPISVTAGGPPKRTTTGRLVVGVISISGRQYLNGYHRSMTADSEDCVREGRTRFQHVIAKMVRSNAARVRVFRKSLPRYQGFSRLASHTVAVTYHHSNSIGKPPELRRARGRFCSALAVVRALSASTTFERFVSRTRYRLIPLVG
jgi:hypothetical protein